MPKCFENFAMKMIFCAKVALQIAKCEMSNPLIDIYSIHALLCWIEIFMQ